MVFPIGFVSSWSSEPESVRTILPIGELPSLKKSSLLLEGKGGRRRSSPIKARVEPVLAGSVSEDVDVDRCGPEVDRRGLDVDRCEPADGSVLRIPEIPDVER